MSEHRLFLEDLEPAGEFARRHIGPDEAEIAAMLEVVGAASLDDLIERATPRAIRSARPLDLPRAKSETEALAVSLGISQYISWRDEVALSEFYAEISSADVVCDQFGDSFPGRSASASATTSPISAVTSHAILIGASTSDPCALPMMAKRPVPDTVSSATRASVRSCA